MKILSVDLDNEDLRDELNKIDKILFPLDELCPKNGWWWVVKDKGDIIAFAGLHPSYNWDDAGYLCRVGVLPSYQGKGLQKRLIRVREKKARLLKYRWLITDTTDNAASANNLISCGYKLYEPDIPWGPHDALYWRKKM